MPFLARDVNAEGFAVFAAKAGLRLKLIHFIRTVRQEINRWQTSS